MKNETISRGLIFTALLIVGGVVIWGFTLVGSPAFNRKLAADKNRRDDLRTLERNVESYFEEQKKLPEKLTDLEKNKAIGYEAPEFEDPTTKKPYGYKVVDPYSYELCADFELTSKEAVLEKNRWDSDSDSRRWEHPSGPHCFQIQIPENKRKGKSP